MSHWLAPEPQRWDLIVEEALIEDIGTGDISAGCLDPAKSVDWFIEAQGPGIVCGVGIVAYLMEPQGEEDDGQYLEIAIRDGEPVSRGTLIAKGRLAGAKALQCERTALNFLMHLSGVATLTSKFVEKVNGIDVRIADTRKTLPGLRVLQKYAVRCGGGYNHRMGLYDAAMVKDNHILAYGSIGEAVDAVRRSISHMTKIEVECESHEQVREAIAARADVIMLDNMDPFSMREIVSAHKGQAIFEASGGINLDTVRGIAETGVDVISVGALTHSAIAVPFHLEL